MLSLEQGPPEITALVLFQKAQACQQRLSKEISDFLAMVKSLDVTKGKTYSYKMQFVTRQFSFPFFLKQHVLSFHRNDIFKLLKTYACFPQFISVYKWSESTLRRSTYWGVSQEYKVEAYFQELLKSVVGSLLQCVTWKVQTAGSLHVDSSLKNFCCSE